MNHRALAVAGALALGAPLLVSGCYARVQGRAPDRGYDVVVDQPGVRVEAYPYVVYDGTPVYWVDGRWYRRNGGGWVYYRQEPAYLSGRRPVTVAPPAYGPRPGVGPGFGAPPAHPSAPPAHRR